MQSECQLLGWAELSCVREGGTGTLSQGETVLHGQPSQVWVSCACWNQRPSAVFRHQKAPPPWKENGARGTPACNPLAPMLVRKLSPK